MNNIYTRIAQRFSAAIKILFVILSCFLFQSQVFGQDATEANISGSSTVINMNNNTATVVDPNLVLTANGNITGFTVSITGSYTSGDALGYTGTLPLGISAAPFNPATRSLVFSGTTSAANWQTLIRTVTLTTTSAVCNPESRLVSFVVGIKYYNILNGHFYEYYGTGTSWTGARAFASALSYFGREGYLATVTALSENSFSSVLVGQNSWIGCSDNYSEINSALGYTLYPNQAAADGNFYWITGPERGVKISAQNAWGAGGTLPVNGIYNAWSGGEPNDWPGQNSGSPGEEDYGHMYTGSGLWNDFPNSSSIGSIIEFGGMPNDNTTSQVVFTRSVFINGAPSGTIIGGNISVCNGSNNTTLTLTGLSGTVVNWEYSLDNFLTPGNAIINSSTLLNVLNITTTTYYRAIVNSLSGCTNLATSSTPLFVNTTVAGNIVAANNSICDGSDAEFTLFGNSGNVIKWQVSTSSTFSSSVTDINVNTIHLSYNLTGTGTYYFRAEVQNSGCGAAVFTPGYTINVVSGTPPDGGSVSSAEHCGGSNSGTLTLSAYTGTIQKWQYSTDGGIIWTDEVNTSSTLNYVGVSANRIYRAVVVNGSCGSDYSSYGYVTVFGTTVTRWDGSISSEWHNASNWCGGVADNGIDIVISSSANNHLELDQNRLIGRMDFNASGRNIILGNYNLTASGFTGSDNDNFVQTNGSGVLKINISNGASAIFPAGETAYNPVTITNNTGNADIISVRVFNEVYNDGIGGYTSSEPRVKRTWDICKTNANGGSGLDFVFCWNAGETFDLTTPALYHYEGGNWNLQTGTTSSGAYNLTYTGYTGTFSPFAIGNNLVPLPVELLSFEAIPLHGSHAVYLSWKTTSENENVKYEVLKSTDGFHWTAMGIVNGAGKSASMNAYEFTDANAGNVNFYRLKIIDAEGNGTLYLIKKVDFNEASANLIKVYPNPSSSFVDLYCAESSDYKIVDVEGRVISEGTLNGHYRITDLPSGLYLVQFTLGQEQYSFKLRME